MKCSICSQDRNDETYFCSTCQNGIKEYVRDVVKYFELLKMEDDDRGHYIHDVGLEILRIFENKGDK